MKFDKIIQTYESQPEIPNVIEESIISLFNVSKLQELQNKADLAKRITNLFYGETKTNYTRNHKEYTLYYLPVNFYKVWQPLMDLLKYNLIQEKFNILELGVGPGSCTLGMIEFFKVLAIDNLKTSFEINFCLIEKEKEFIDIFDNIFENYKLTFPENLNININWIHADLNNDIIMNNTKYDFIIESNMLNHNEKISQKVIDNLIELYSNNLNKHSSIIFIEPADEKVVNYLKKIKQKLKQLSFNSFSPCCCDASVCKQFASAKNYIGKSKIIKELRSIEEFRNLKFYHYFEYVVLRNDGLKKYKSFDNKILLNSINNYIGQDISFKAFILSSSNQQSKIVLKVCDGSLCERKDIWFEIPKTMLMNQRFNPIDINRGEFIEVKRAKIVAQNKIICNLHSQIKVMR